MCQAVLGFQRKNGLIGCKSIFIDRCQITPGEKMRFGFFEQLGQILFLVVFFLVGQPDAANGFLCLFEVQTVFPYG
jgi:hypothetical protein